MSLISSSRHREIVAVEHQEIGVFAGRQRAEIAFLKQEEGIRAGMRDQRLLAGDGLPVYLWCRRSSRR